MPYPGPALKADIRPAVAYVDPRMRLRPLAILLPAVALLAGGCFGGDESEPRARVEAETGRSGVPSPEATPEAGAEDVIRDWADTLRRGDVEAVHSLRRGAAEALEAVARGDAKSSKVVGRCVEELKLPKGAQVGAIVRGLHNEGQTPRVLMAHHDTMIESNDHVIIFLPHKRMVREVERRFQVGVTFF